MTLAYILNIEELIAPISAEKPQGEDIREDRSPSASFYKIKDARNSGRAAERAVILEPNTDIITPWQTVINEAETILKHQSKDIEVTCWLIEAMIRLYGLTGLRDGFVLLDKLIDLYWTDLYPEPDEDGIETKVMPITGLNGESGEGTLLTPMRNALLNDGYSDSPFTLWEYQQALNADNIPDAKEKIARVAEMGYSISTIQESIRKGNAQFFTDFFASLNEASSAYKHLIQTLRGHCANDTPPSSNINNLLDEIIRTCQFIYKDKLISNQPAPASSQASQSDDEVLIQNQEATGMQIIVRDGAIVDREDALKRLADIADYFRQYEPHTPIGPSIERIVKWGRLTVAELMLELLPDDHAKGIYSQLTGVLLDGTDTKSYVAPPITTNKTPVASASPNQPVAEKPAKASSGW